MRDRPAWGATRFVLALLVLLVAGGSSLAGESITLVEDAGLRVSVQRVGVLQQGEEWIPVLVRITNGGTTHRAGELRFDRDAGVTRVTWAFEVSPGLEKSRIIAVRAPDSYALATQVRLVGDDGALLAESSLDLGWFGATNNLTWIVGGEGTGARGLARDLATSRVASLEIHPEPILTSTLPDCLEGYTSVDHIILVGVDPGELSARQHSVLERAVRGGLVVWLVEDGQGVGGGWVVGPRARRSEPLVLRSSTAEPAGSYVSYEDDPGEPGKETASIWVAEGSFRPVPLYLRYRFGLGEWRRCAAYESNG
ncbi:MAG: hypothetical protein KDC38_19710, partial [Planctomycetes bacterium]|nr:hypothetical protein [Planctomycetota bacterium]